MIAKLIAHGADRDEALDRLAAALAETLVEGVTTNLPFLRWLVAHPAFRRASSRPTSSRATRRSPHRPRHLPAGPWGDGVGGSTSPRTAARVLAVEAAAPRRGVAGGDGRVTAPMPGKVIDVKVEPGAQVESHQPLVVLEAMKMEQIVTAPYDAAVGSVDVSVGDQVTTGAVLVTLETG